MNIVNGLYERITDFENILGATKGKSYNEAFKWRGKNYKFAEFLKKMLRTCSYLIVNFWYLSNLKEIKYLRYVS